jgi:hypothetical protein
MNELQRIWYVLSSEERSFIVSELLEDKWESTHDLFSKFKNNYPYLARLGFFPRRISIGTILSDALTTADAVEGDKEPRIYPFGGPQTINIWKSSEIGNELKIYLQYGFEMGFRFDRCLMEILGYERGGAAKVDVPTIRIDILKKIALKGETDAYHLGEELGIEHAARHVRFMASSGIIDVDEVQTPETESTYLFIYTGRVVREDSSPRVKSIAEYIHGHYKAGDMIPYGELKAIPGFPKKTEKIARITEEMVNNGFLKRYIKNELITVRSNPKTHEFINLLVTPIENSVKGDMFYDGIIKSDANSYKAHKEERLGRIVKRFVEFYKHH